MEDVSKQFPLLIKTVLNNLDDETLAKAKEASREISRILDRERFYWIQIIKKCARNCKQFGNIWFGAVNKIEAEIVKLLALAIQKLYKYYPEMQELSPLHIAASVGSLQLYEYIITKTMGTCNRLHHFMDLEIFLKYLSC